VSTSENGNVEFLKQGSFPGIPQMIADFHYSSMALSVPYQFGSKFSANGRSKFLLSGNEGTTFDARFMFKCCCNMIFMIHGKRCSNLGPQDKKGNIQVRMVRETKKP
jgi:hypothetical protein